MQIAITNTEEQESRLTLQKSQMKSSITNLEQRTNQLMRKNEELTEKNTELTEKNSTYRMEIESTREECESRGLELERLRRETERAVRERAQVTARLEQAHSELNFMASMYHSASDTHKHLKGEQPNPFSGTSIGWGAGDHGGSATGRGVASENGGPWEASVDEIQSVNSLHKKLTSLADTLQEERSRCS